MASEISSETLPKPLEPCEWDDGDVSSYWMEMFNSSPWVEMHRRLGGDNAFVWLASFDGEGYIMIQKYEVIFVVEQIQLSCY